MKPRRRATHVTIQLHTGPHTALTHTRSRAPPGISVKKTTGREKEHLLTIGLGKDAAIAHVTRSITQHEFEQVKHALMNVLDEMGKRQGKKTAAQNYTRVSQTGRIRDGKWRKTYTVQKPLRVMVPAKAEIVVQHFDALARESQRVERARQWKRVTAFAKVVSKMIRNPQFKFIAGNSSNRFTRDVESYINRPFITNDSEFFSYVLSQFPNITAAKKLLARHQIRLGRKKYAEINQMLGEWHAHARQVPLETGKLLEFFVRKRNVRDPNAVAYDFYPRPQGWADPRAAPF